MWVVVPDSLYNAIHARLDEAFEQCPEAEKDREALYSTLLAYFNEHGVIPEFTLRAKQ